MNDSSSMSSPPLDPHRLEQTTAEGPWGGPTYSYRGARIECLKGGHVCGLFMDGHPIDRLTFGVVGTLTPLVDGWIDSDRLLSYMRAVPRQSS
jgi:hypothetical protein